MSIILRPDQAAVAAYRSGYMAVPAVPGAGKTTVLAHLAAELIAGGFTGRGRILIVTYTNSGVGNFRSRIGEFLAERGLPPYQGYEVRTIHSLALQLLRDRPEALGWSDGFAVIDDSRAAELLGRLTREWIAANRELWESRLKPELNAATREGRVLPSWERKTGDLFRSLIQAFKSRRLDPTEAFRLTRSLPPESGLRWAAEVYGPYQRELALTGAVDYNDLILGAHRLVSGDAPLLQRLRERWPYIFEDEAQDSYRLQEEILRLLAGPEGNLVRVGDANQAILGTFTSADPDLFRRFCREPGVSVRPLTMAGRSSTDIIDLANELVGWSRTFHPEPGCRDALESQLIQPVPPGYPQANPRPDGYRIFLGDYSTSEDELKALAAMAARSVARGPDTTVAVLLPSNAMVDAVLTELEAAGVKTRRLGGATSDERQQTVRELLAIMAFLAAPHAAAPEARDAHGRWLKDALLPPDELIIHLALGLGLEGEALAIGHHLALRARRLLLEQPALGLAGLLEVLQGEIQAMGRFADQLLSRKGFKPEPGEVCVATCHSAKGLEWDTVYLGGLTRHEFPSMAGDKVLSELWYFPDDAPNPEALALADLALLTTDPAGEGTPATDPVRRAKLDLLAERLRLLYVAMTRARENLRLSVYRKDTWGRSVAPALAVNHLAGFIRRREGGGP